MAKVLTPHDPATDTGPCAICNVPWPCPERQRQRRTIWHVKQFLQSDLFSFKRQVTDSEGTEWSVWTTKLGFRVDLAYGAKGIRAKVFYPPSSNNRPIHKTLDASIDWLDQHLP